MSIYITTKEVSSALDLSERSVRKLAETGKLKVVKSNNINLYSLESVFALDDVASFNFNRKVVEARLEKQLLSQFLKFRDATEAV